MSKKSHNEPHQTKLINNDSSAGTLYFERGLSPNSNLNTQKREQYTHDLAVPSPSSSSLLNQQEDETYLTKNKDFLSNNSLPAAPIHFESGTRRDSNDDSEANGEYHPLYSPQQNSFRHPLPQGHYNTNMSESPLHHLLDENQSLLYQLESMSYHFQLEKLEYQRRLRHLLARVQYLEGVQRLSQSPNRLLSEFKPYHNSRKYFYNTKRRENP